MENLSEFRKQLNDVDGAALELSEGLNDLYSDDEKINELIEALENVSNLITDVQSAQKWI